MARPQGTSSPSPPFITTLLLLVALAIATITAFLLAINVNHGPLASLWTPCSPCPLSTPICFAIRFFQSAHATPRGRREQAVIVSFLAGLATLTAVESERVNNDDDTRREEEEKKKKKKKKNTGSPASKAGWLSRTVIANLTIPWLLYSLVLGALAWQGIIIPAFLYHHHQQQQQQRRINPRSNKKEANATAARSPTIPLSITLALLLPTTTMLSLHPTVPSAIILFLLFPLVITLTHYLLRPLTTHLTLPHKTLLYAPAITASTIAHAALLLLPNLFPGPQPLHPSSTTRAALLLLELDHTAIFLAALYWIHHAAGARGVAATLGATVTLGPGAGVCVGWLCRCEEEEAPTERQKGGKATGSFFGEISVA